MNTLPMTVTEPGLPAEVTIYEVGPRDGLQAETAQVPTAVKLRLIAALAAAGLRYIEATSFVPARWVPQLGDAAEVMSRLDVDDGRKYPVLVPNIRGLERAIAAGAADIAVFSSATESFARANFNRDVTGVIDMLAPVVGRARHEGLSVRGYVSMAFGDPWEGRVPIDQVIATVARLRQAGCDRISLGDTIGVATAGHVKSLVSALRSEGVPPEALAMHFHDTYGQALTNVYAALSCGVTEFDASVGGIGGCPYAKSATGNLATEDLVWMLRGLGIETGVDLDALLAISQWMTTELGRPSPSRVVTALTAQGDKS